MEPRLRADEGGRRVTIVGPATDRAVDLATETVRELNLALHRAESGSSWVVENPSGAHNIAVGIAVELDLTVKGHVGYYFAGMHQRGDLRVEGSAGVGLAENIMSGTVRVTGDASQAVAATGRGGLVVVGGNTGARCGISMKGVDIVVGGDIGHASAFMAQAGRLVVCGNAGDGLGDSIYEARIYVQGDVGSLGTDCVEKPMRAEHLEELAELLAKAGRPDDPLKFRRFGSARSLYHFKVDNAGSY